MSRLTMVEVIDEHAAAPPLGLMSRKSIAKDQEILDQHPRVPVFIAGIIALALSSAMVGAILIWLSLRNSGLMAR